MISKKYTFDASRSSQRKQQTFKKDRKQDKT